MSYWSILCVVFVAVTAVTNARGPVCLNCTSVSSPEDCRTVKECWDWESCYGEHFLFDNGTEAFTFGCRTNQLCEQNNDVEKRFDLVLCKSCCSGDLCNNNVCTNGTEPPPGLPCLSCSGVPTPLTCTDLTYCGQGEVCYTESASSTPNPAYNMGCLRHEVCSFFQEEIIGKRSAASNPRDPSICHECCESSACNHGACSQTQTTSTPSVPTSTTFPTTIAPATPHSCWDLLFLHNITNDGIHTVVGGDGRLISVYCDMTTDGGGWTVFQKRYNGDINFDQTYAKYRTGFGTLSHEFWMGNDLLHEMTADNKQKLRIDMCDWAGAAKRAEYDFFSVAAASDKYRLSVASYSGDAGDALITGSGGDQYHNNRQFSTSDSDNDASHSRHCAQDFRSGWWFGACFSANLNGIYLVGGPVDAGKGLQWRLWREQYSLKGTELKFRPASANPPSHIPFSCPVN